MVLALNKHQDGCVPFKRCRACSVVDTLNGTGNKKLIEMFDPDSEEPSFEPGIHLPGCSPIDPCTNCMRVMLLRTVFSDAKLKVLIDLFDDAKPIVTPSQEPDESSSFMKDRLMQPLDKLELSVRTHNALVNNNVRFVGDICKLSEDDLSRTPQFGKRSMSELKGVLGDMGLHLGMEFSPNVYSPE